MKWDTPRVAVDAILLHEDRLVLVRRGREPFRGRYALPGGFLEFGEALEDAIRREVLEETGLTVALEGLLGVYGDPRRDPRGHAISVAYVVRAFGGRPHAGTDASAVKLVSPARTTTLAFDHNRIVADFLAWRRWPSSSAFGLAPLSNRGGREARKPRGRASNRDHVRLA